MADLDNPRFYRSSTNSSKWSHFIKDKKVGEGTYAVVYSGWAIPANKEEVNEQVAQDSTGEKDRLAKDKKVGDQGGHLDIEWRMLMSKRRLLNLSCPPRQPKRRMVKEE